MALIHSMEAFARSGLVGVQSLQRDWSPYVVHFTTYGAMKTLRNWSKTDRKPKTIQNKIREADGKSFGVVEKIAASKSLLANSPSEKDGIAKCVCLSECNLPGLVGHSERYGRFGFVFDKSTIFRAGGRPCCYVATDEYSVIAGVGRGKPASTAEGRLFSLTNVYTPPGGNGKVQDFTHEREWRVFGDIDFHETPPVLLFAPSAYIGQMQDLFPNATVMSLDILFHWGS